MYWTGEGRDDRAKEVDGRTGSGEGVCGYVHMERFLFVWGVCEVRDGEYVEVFNNDRQKDILRYGCRMNWIKLGIGC
jgi:hypothetical protein